MPITLDVANVGTNTGDAGGASPDITVTTGTVVNAPDALYSTGKLVFATVVLDSAGAACTVTTITGGGVGWMKLNQRRDAGDATTTATFYAFAPNGLAASTVLTCAVTLNFFEWAIVVSAYKADYGFCHLQAADNNAQSSGSSWTTLSLILARPGLFITGLGWRTPTTPATNTPTSPGVEDQELASSPTITAVTQRRIETVGGAYTLGGTMDIATDGAAWLTNMFGEKPPPKPDYSRYPHSSMAQATGLPRAA